MADLFQVKGQNITTNDPYTFKSKPQSRKVFNTKWLEQKSYEHEIANHYRDYKQQKICGTRNRYRPKNVLLEQMCDNRDVLPIKRIDFPQSILPRPQSENCRFPLLKNIYNPTLQRVVAADSLSELKLLTKRHSRINKPKSWSSFDLNISSFGNKDYRTSCGRKREKHYNLGHTGPGDKLLFEKISVYNPKTRESKVNENRVSVAEFSEEGIIEDKDNYLIQLASECYNEGFLTHIKYLESIGKRNAINNQISKRKPQHISDDKPTTASRLQSSGSNVSSNNSVKESSHNTGVRKFIFVVKSVLQNRFFIQNPCDGQTRSWKHDWKIRVNITRSLTPENLNYCQSCFLKFKDNIKSNHCIMSEILNVNEDQPQVISASNASTVKHQHFHNLIENLSNLEISELGSLPKIVLTDFSTTNIVTDSTTTPRARLSENTIIRQQSLEVELPHISDYSSEARPP